MRKIRISDIDFEIDHETYDVEETVYCKTYDMYGVYQYCDLVDINGELCSVEVYDVPFYGELMIDENSHRIFKEFKTYKEYK